MKKSISFLLILFLIGTLAYRCFPESISGSFIASLCADLISIRITLVFSTLIAGFALILAFSYAKYTSTICKNIDKFRNIVNHENFDDWEEEIKKQGLEESFGKIQTLLSNSCNSVSALLQQSDGTMNNLCRQRNGLIMLKSPREFINEDVIYYSRVNTALYHSVPGALTGLGIFFTFVGLAAGVTLATQGLLPSQGDSVGIAPTNIGVLLNSIGDLLEGAGQAFITSICGLLFSLIFGQMINVTEHTIQTKLEDLNNSIEAAIPRVTPELLALINVDKVASQENMVRELKDGWDHLSDELVDKLCERMDKTSAAQTEALVKAIDDLKEVTEKSLNVQNKLVNDHVTEAMQKFTEMLSTSMKEMTKSFDDSAKGVGRAVTDLDKILHATNDTMGNVTAAIEQSLAQMMDRLSDIESRISQSSTDLEQNMIKMVEHARTMSNTVEQAGEAFKSSSSEAADAWTNHVQTSGQHFADQVQQTGEAFSTHLLDSIRQSSETLSTSFESIAKDAERFSGSLSTATNEQKALLEEFNNIRSAIGDANQHLSTMLNECRATVELITANHDTFAATIKALLADVKHGQTAMTGATAEVTANLNAGLAQVIDMQRKVCETTDNLHKLMTEGITKLATALNQMNDSIATNMTTMDRGLSEAIGSMSTGLEAWTELQDDVSTTLKKNAGEFQNSINQVAHFVQSLEKSIARVETRLESAQNSTQSVAKK